MSKSCFFIISYKVFGKFMLTLITGINLIIKNQIFANQGNRYYIYLIFLRLGMIQRLRIN